MASKLERELEFLLVLQWCYPMLPSGSIVVHIYSFGTPLSFWNLLKQLLRLYGVQLQLLPGTEDASLASYTLDQAVEVPLIKIYGRLIYCGKCVS